MNGFPKESPFPGADFQVPCSTSGVFWVGSKFNEHWCSISSIPIFGGDEHDTLNWLQKFQTLDLWPLGSRDEDAGMPKPQLDRGMTRCWQLKHFLFLPLMIQFDEYFGNTGWNHQLDEDVESERSRVKLSNNMIALHWQIFKNVSIYQASWCTLCYEEGKHYVNARWISDHTWLQVQRQGIQRYPNANEKTVCFSFS